jgi:hypothetical protein
MPIWLLASIALIVAGLSGLAVPTRANQPTVQACANLFEDLIAMRAQRAGLYVARFQESQAQILAPANLLATLPSNARHYDMILMDREDPSRPLAIEATIGSVTSPVKKIQLVKDHLGMTYGVYLKNINYQIMPNNLRTVWVLGYRPAQATLQAMANRGIGYYNFLNGESNIQQLKDYFRPSMRMMQNVLIPGQLTEYGRRVAQWHQQADSKAYNVIQAIVAMTTIYRDISSALDQKAVHDEIRAGLSLSLHDVKREYAANETFYVDITTGSNLSGPYGHLYWFCTPPLNYAHVSDVGPANPPCVVGSQSELPTIRAPGQYYHARRVCMQGGVSAPSSRGGGA